MLTESEIDKAADSLAAYRSNDALAGILDQYSTLLSDYKRLKSDYEEEREGRERYKQLARGQERNPFVLVLIDGDGYIFNQELAGAKEEGGSRAAKQLNDAIKTSLRRKGLDNCEVIIRVYANLVGLSKVLARHGMCGHEKRSFASFTAGFNRSYGLTDFVDAGELKENADFKLKAMLRLYADNTQCKHVYFAACHDVGYVSDLTPYRDEKVRFTMIRTPSLSFHPEFTRLGFGIEELDDVFRSAPLESSPNASTKASPLNATRSQLATATAASTPDSAQPQPVALSTIRSQKQKLCPFYQASKCKNGSACKLSHGDSGGSSSYTTDRPTQANGAVYQPPRPEDDTSSHGHRRGASDVGDFKHLLPRHENIPKGSIAVNKNQHRLDAYIPPPSGALISRLKARSESRKLCNSKHLIGVCDDPKCEYDHTPLDKEFLPALESLSRSIVCPRKGDCRNASCVSGHICQRADCSKRKGKAFCRFSYMSHSEDLALNGFVPARAKTARDQTTWRGTAEGSLPNSPPTRLLTPPRLNESEDEENGAVLV